MRTFLVLAAMCLMGCMAHHTTIESSTHATTSHGVSIPFLYSGGTVSSESRVVERPIPEPRAMPAYAACLPGSWCEYYRFSYTPSAYAATPPIVQTK